MEARKIFTKKANDFLRKISWRLFWLAPNTITPIGLGHIKDHKKHDSKENAETRLPENIEIRSEQFYAVELYGPAEIETLYSRLEELGWNQDAVIDRPSPSDWIRRQRAYGHGGAWLNLGPVVRKKDRGKFFNLRNYTSLPEEFEYVDIAIFQITPSLTALSIAFFINDVFANSYKEELEKPRSSYYCRGKNWSIITVSPAQQKSAAALKFRENMRFTCRNWIAENFPGIFCRNGQMEAFPSLEVLVCKGYSLKPAPGEPAFSQWRHALVNIAPHDVWTHSIEQGIQLAFCDFAFDKSSMHSIATLDHESFSEEKIKTYGGTSNKSLCRYARDELEQPLIHQACISYLKEQNKNLNKSRERIEALSKNHKNSKEVISQIQSFFSGAAGIRILSKELNDLAEKSRLYFADLKPYQADSWNNEEKISLHNSAQKHLSFHSKRVMEEEVALRSHLEQITTILNTVESISAQRRMERLTVVAVLVAIGSLWAALPDFTKMIAMLQKLMSWLSHF